ncbi:unnamed protein product, partial [Rotaria sp. Silwood2]
INREKLQIELDECR